MRMLVIGGSKGIGKAIVEEAYNIEDIKVISLSRSSIPKLDLTASQEEIRHAIKAGIEILGGLDALVVSAGMGAYLGPSDVTEERVRNLFQTNFIGPIECFYAAQKALIQSRGRVLFIGSTVARHGARSLGCYAATKAAIEGWVKSESRQYIRKGVAINVLAPGWIETEMTAEIKPELKEAIIRSIPAKRMGQPQEIAEFAVAILRQSNFLTGSIIDMCGGT